MTSNYERLILELKNKLKNKFITFDVLFRIINSQKYNKDFIIINDESIHTLIENIITERERIGANMEKKLNDLLWLNERLIQFGEEPQPSKTKARKILKTIAINIYDLEAEKYEKRTSFNLLRRELNNKPERRFPLGNAKKCVNLKCFLIDCCLKCKKVGGN